MVVCLVALTGLRCRLLALQTLSIPSQGSQCVAAVLLRGFLLGDLQDCFEDITSPVLSAPLEMRGAVSAWFRNFVHCLVQLTQREAADEAIRREHMPSTDRLLQGCRLPNAAIKRVWFGSKSTCLLQVAKQCHSKPSRESLHTQIQTCKVNARKVPHDTRT